MADINFYKNGIEQYKNFNPVVMTKQAVHDWFVGKLNPFWVRSLEYYQKNYKAACEGKPTTPYDDEHLRTVILPLLPIHYKTKFDIAEIKANLYNPEWWYENFRDVENIINNAYVKKAIREDAKRKHGYLIGAYYSWLTRLLQWLNTYTAEFALPKMLKLTINAETHSYLHLGIATAEELEPDFVDFEGHSIELKVCSEKCLSDYTTKLLNNFEYTKKYDFHSADFGLFLTKGKEQKLFTVDLRTPGHQMIDMTERLTEKIDLIQMDDNGKLAEQDWPSIPKSLLFGLKASWLKY